MFDLLLDAVRLVSHHIILEQNLHFLLDHILLNLQVLLKLQSLKLFLVLLQYLLSIVDLLQNLYLFALVQGFAFTIVALKLRRSLFDWISLDLIGHINIIVSFLVSSAIKRFGKLTLKRFIVHLFVFPRL